MRSDAEHVEAWLGEAHESRVSTAYHEAGHVAAAVLLRVGVESVTIAPSVEDLCWGVVVFRSPAPSRAELLELKYESLTGGVVRAAAASNRRVANRILVALAGPFADQRARAEGLVPPARVRPVDPLARELLERDSRDTQFALERVARERSGKLTPGYRNDSQAMRYLAEESTGTEAEAEAFLAMLVQRAGCLVDSSRFWDITCAVAEALLERETLTGRQMHAVIRRALPVIALPIATAGGSGGW